MPAFLNRGLRRSLRVALHELRVQRDHRAALRKAKRYAGAQGLRLNVGCGSNYKAGWVNLDRAPGTDLSLDLREDLPFADGSAAWIYSEHFFEHLQFPKEAGRFLRECFRVLAPGGRLDIGVPDTAWPIQAYTDDKLDYFRLARERFHPKWCNTRMHHLNFHFRQGEEHKYAYDEETLLSILVRAGYAQVRRRDFDPVVDSPARAVGTLYVRAVRP